MKTMVSKLEQFVQGELTLTNREALALIHEYRLAIEKESRDRKRKTRHQEEQLHKIVEKLGRG